VGTGLKFENSPYPFTPHCTIADLGNSPIQETLDELDRIPHPTNDIIVNAISFYQLTPNSCELLHRSFFDSFN
jgi:2'-5' RNA ligase